MLFYVTFKFNNTVYSVAIKPGFIQLTQFIITDERDEVIIPCQANFMDRFSIEWKNKKMITDSRRYHNLKICKVITDNWIYTWGSLISKALINQ